MIPITFNKIMQSNAYTVVILGAEDKRFAIYMDPRVGRNMQLYLTEAEKPRPYTHDLLKSLLQGFDIAPIQVVIHDVEDTVYYARLYLEQTVGELRVIVEIDARPSDAITLALMHNVPIYCRKEVLDKAVPVEE